MVRLGGSSPHRINIMDLALDWDDERGGYKKGRPLDKFIPLLTSWLEYQIDMSRSRSWHTAAGQHGRTIVKTSDLKVLFDQGEALPDVQQHCQLSDAEAPFVKESPPGHGLYILGPYRLPFLLLLSAYQYEYFTTKPGEMKEL